MSCLDVIAGRKYNEYIYVLGFELSNYDYVSKYTDSILLNFILIESLERCQIVNQKFRIKSL